ncbi:MAG TPA: hypothetical protein VGF89_06950 [Steroidobacteraceae bacterium]|jgi:hypothetical protein
MLRVLFFLVATACPAAWAGSAPDACQLLTAIEASTVAGVPLALGGHAGGGECRYYGSGGAAANALEISVKVEPDAASARANFARWAAPAPGSSELAIVPVDNVGDQASITRNGSSRSGICFRRGAVLVRIGVHPGVSDSALTAAAITMLSRM